VSEFLYNCVEQFKQHRKALLFDDDIRAAQILDTTEPNEQNRLGLKVKHFYAEEWRKMTNVLMHKANFNKFTQNKNIEQELLSTTGTTIAQACPFRGDWCAGYYVTETNCQNRQTWTGNNKLGQILSNLREEITYKENKVTQINSTGMCFELEVDVGTQQRACPEIGHYFRYIEEKKRPIDPKCDRRILHDYRDFYIRDNNLWHVNNTRGRTRSIQEYIHQKVMPICLTQELLHHIHDVGLCHAGTDRTVMAIRRHYYWPSLSRDVKKYVKTCKDCQEGKSYHRYKALLKTLAIPNRFGQTLHIDHVGPIKPGPNSEKYIFMVIYSFSQWPWTFAVHNTGADVAANCLLKVVSEAGAFKHLISDNAASFTGKVMTQFCKLFDIQKIHIASYHSASNGKNERLYSSLANSLKVSVTHNRDWVEMLPFIEHSVVALLRE